MSYYGFAAPTWDLDAAMSGIETEIKTQYPKAMFGKSIDRIEVTVFDRTQTGEEIADELFQLADHGAREGNGKVNTGEVVIGRSIATVRFVVEEYTEMDAWDDYQDHKYHESRDEEWER